MGEVADDETRNFNARLDRRSIENLRVMAKRVGLSRSAFLRLILSTPAAASDTIHEVRERIRKRMEELEKPAQFPRERL